MAADHKTPYREVRALERALALVDTMGEIGWAGPTTLARQTGIDRATIYRLLATLVRCGYVVRRQQDAKFFLSPHIRTLGYGIRDEDVRVQLVSKPLQTLVEAIKWPSDFGALAAGRLTIIDSNYAFTTMTLFRSVIGQSRPVLRSALGRAIVSAMSDAELADAAKTVVLAGGQDAEDFKDSRMLADVIANTRRRGYAAAAGEATPNIGAIALPVMVRGRVAGAINVVIFRSQFNVEKAAAQYLTPLRDCVAEVELAFELAAEAADAERAAPAKSI